MSTGIPRGARVASKAELANLLDEWYRTTRAPTIGDSQTYGRAAWIHLVLTDGHVVLNADTRREAVRNYLDDVGRRGAEVPWRVVANARGSINKVLYDASRPRQPGWYCYLVGDLAAERDL